MKNLKSTHPYTDFGPQMVYAFLWREMIREQLLYMSCRHPIIYLMII